MLRRRGAGKGEVERRQAAMSTRRGPPKHKNQFAWKPNAGRKINETEVGGRFRPLSEITGVCPRCKEQIDWKRRYGKYKPLTEPAKCQSCSKRNVRQAYHNLCNGCAKEQKVCAKCRCSVRQIVGRDAEEVEAEQKMLEEAIQNARERDRRSLIRAMNKGKPKGSPAISTNKENGRVGEVFPATSLEEYAKRGRNDAKAHISHGADEGDTETDEDGESNDVENGEEDYNDEDNAGTQDCNIGDEGDENVRQTSNA